MDYNIYIRSSGVAYTNPTTPWNVNSTPETTPWEAQGTIQEGESILNEFKNATAGSMTSKGGIGGVVGFLKNIPVVGQLAAVAILAVKTTDKILSFTADTKALALGDYDMQTNYKNFKANVQSLFHPISTMKTRMNFNFELNRLNQKRTLERELLGDSLINQYTGRGV